MITALSLFLILLATITYFTSEIGWHNITETKRNAIVFENKNQRYGAYTIRAAYNDSMLKAVGIMLLIVMAFFSGNLIWKNLFREQLVTNVPPMETNIPVELFPDEFIPKTETSPPMASAPPAATVVEPIGPPVIVTEIPMVTPPLQGTAPTAVGTSSGNGVLPSTGSTGGTGTEVSAPASPAAALDRAEVNPSFQGGDAALMNYLSKNIRYPDQEKDNGIAGTVYISFVVNSTGEITDIKEMRGVRGGPNLSKEAIRVIMQMPKWNPGKMNGKPVSVRFNLPIKFILN